MIWLQFIISAAVIVFSGIRLTTYADILGDRLQIGKVWIGIILLGFVTSLPEAVASLTAIVSLGSPDLAVGNMVGSNNFNPVLIVVMDMAYRRGSVTNKISFKRSHGVSALFAILLTCIVAGEIIAGARTASFMIGPVSLGSFCILVVYFLGVRVLAGMGKGGRDVPPRAGQCVSTTSPKNRECTYLYARLFLSALLVVVAAVWLASTADTIAKMTGLGQTFVGTFFLAMVTSLPEMVVTISALKLGVLDLAIGNIFGSNMINMFLVFVCDAFYVKGPLLAAVSKTHALTAVLSIVLTGIVLVGIRGKHKKTIWGLGWDSVLLISFFAAGMGLVYQLR